MTQQICLGYAFGDGRQTSCEVTVEAVENLLGGQAIDQYLAMGLDGISTLNDLAGGVTVTLEDDFSAIDPAMTKGTTSRCRASRPRLMSAPPQCRCRHQRGPHGAAGKLHPTAVGAAG